MGPTESRARVSMLSGTSEEPHEDSCMADRGLSARAAIPETTQPKRLPRATSFERLTAFDTCISKRDTAINGFEVKRDTAINGGFVRKRDTAINDGYVCKRVPAIDTIQYG